MGEVPVDLLDSLIALFHTKIDQRNGIIASYFTSTTSSSCRHGCFTEENPRGTGVPAKEKMSLCDFKLHIAECLSIQTANPEA